MGQPVRLGLVFPRSGQQVVVRVPLNVPDNSDSRSSSRMWLDEAAQVADAGEHSSENAARSA